MMPRWLQLEKQIRMETGFRDLKQGGCRFSGQYRARGWIKC